MESREVGRLESRKARIFVEKEVKKQKKGIVKESGDGFVRADQIDLKSLDEQLERHLSKVWTMDKNKRNDDDGNANLTAAASATAPITNSVKKERQEWEIEPPNSSSRASLHVAPSVLSTVASMMARMSPVSTC